MDLSDIQGLVFHPYKRMPHAAYVMLRFRQNRHAAARGWLAELLNTQSIDTATPKESGPPDRAGVRLNIAFTYTGLRALGLDADALSTFPLAFAEGLGARWTSGEADHRSRALGDVGDAAPDKWHWGYDDQRVDALLIIFATELIPLMKEIKRWTNEAVDRGAIGPGSSTELFGKFPVGDAPIREPFGFVDGISQPVLKGARGLLGDKEKQPPVHALDDGEILLGHLDGARQIAASPTVHETRDPGHVLPAAYDDAERRDIGYNGTYLVFRQIAQDVAGFNDACSRAANAAGIPVDRFKALLVGRWQDGSPLVKCPIAHDPEHAAAPSGNDFDYRNDPHGERCPIGAHIRRANPRDSLGNRPEESLRVANRHRVLRRGRPYQDGPDAGLHFICLNASIERQFEFIQQNWINDSTFGGLDGEDDPIVGQRLKSGAVTLPPPAESRWRRRVPVPGLSRFVTVRGGAYFFLPSLTALRYLAGLPAAEPRHRAWSPTPERLRGHERVRFISLVRFQILLVLILFFGPFAAVGRTTLPTITRPMFIVASLRDMLIVSAIASLAATLAMVAYRVAALHATARFGVNAPQSRVLTWKQVLVWQVVSMPIVGMTLWLTARDAMIREGTVELAMHFARFGVAALAGYAAALLVMFVAEILRSLTVRPVNAEHAMILPRLRALDRLMKRSRSRLRSFGETRGISKVVRFFEGIHRFVQTTLATWPSGRGAGYIDSETGWILPGHITAAVLVVVITVIYLLGWYVLWPPAKFQLPPLAYLLFVVMMIGSAAAGAAFLVDRFRVPLLTVLVAALAGAVLVGGTDHEFIVLDRNLSATPTAKEAIAFADRYRADHHLGSSADPIVIVAAGGGGAHQAAWTTRVLTGLTMLWGRKFSGNLRLISAVSAGTVGAMHYVLQFQNGPPDGETTEGEDNDLENALNASKAAATADVWWGITYPDLTRTLWPIGRVIPATLDRGRALELAWCHAMKLDKKCHQPTMSDWRAGVAQGRQPAVAFNAMVVETGQRAVLATYGVQTNPSIKDLEWLTGYKDLPVITAARLAAAFPYVTPAARPSNHAQSVHLIDGGYWDNHAIVTILEWLLEAEVNGRPVLVVTIPPPSEPQPNLGNRAWPWQMTAPLEAAVSMRTDAQRTRADLERKLLNAAHTGIAWAEFPYEGGNTDTLLSWHLSRRERCDIDKIWNNTYGQAANEMESAGRHSIETIAVVLNQRPSRWTPSSDPECPQ